MVSILLSTTRMAALLSLCLLASAAPKPKTPPAAGNFGLEMDGGRRLTFERSFSSDRDVRRPGFFAKLVDFVAGSPDLHWLVRPYGVVEDRHGRVIIADPGAAGIHVFDFAQGKYRFLSRREAREPLTNPQCVAVDSSDNIYVTDSEQGKVFVFSAAGKFLRTIGSLRGGEGFFKRPTGIAVDAEAGRIFVTDTWRNRIFVLDMQGAVLQTIGKTGAAHGEFNFPTELKFAGDDLAVVDAMNFRVQVLSRAGEFRYAIGQAGDAVGSMFRPKGIGTDSEGHLYVADTSYGVVQVFDRDGRLLYYFGHKGTAPEPLQMPAGLYVSGANRIFVADSRQRRIQVFQYSGGGK
jgi:DNA-binding beta-propeller fold protein YncE